MTASTLTDRVLSAIAAAPESGAPSTLETIATLVCEDARKVGLVTANLVRKGKVVKAEDGTYALAQAEPTAEVAEATSTQEEPAAAATEAPSEAKAEKPAKPRVRAAKVLGFVAAVREALPQETASLDDEAIAELVWRTTSNEKAVELFKRKTAQG